MLHIWRHTLRELKKPSVVSRTRLRAPFAAGTLPTLTKKYMLEERLCIYCNYWMLTHGQLRKPSVDSSRRRLRAPGAAGPTVAAAAYVDLLHSWLTLICFSSATT